jgi:hypothetical protein
MMMMMMMMMVEHHWLWSDDDGRTSLVVEHMVVSRSRVSLLCHKATCWCVRWENCETRNTKHSFGSARLYCVAVLLAVLLLSLQLHCMHKIFQGVCVRY